MEIYIYNNIYMEIYINIWGGPINTRRERHNHEATNWHPRMPQKAAEVPPRTFTATTYIYIYTYLYKLKGFGFANRCFNDTYILKHIIRILHIFIHIHTHIYIFF